MLEGTWRGHVVVSINRTARQDQHASMETEAASKARCKSLASYACDTPVLAQVAKKSCFGCALSCQDVGVASMQQFEAKAAAPPSDHHAALGAAGEIYTQRITAEPEASVPFLWLRPCSCWPTWKATCHHHSRHVRDFCNPDVPSVFRFADFRPSGEPEPRARNSSSLGHHKCTRGGVRGSCGRQCSFWLSWKAASLHAGHFAAAAGTRLQALFFFLRLRGERCRWMCAIQVQGKMNVSDSPRTIVQEVPGQRNGGAKTSPKPSNEIALLVGSTPLFLCPARRLR